MYSVHRPENNLTYRVQHPRKEISLSVLSSTQVLRIGYYQVDPRVVGSSILDLERHLGKLGKVSITAIKDISLGTHQDFELLVIAGPTLEDHSFGSWLNSFKRKIAAQGDIWVPAIIIADISFQALEVIWADVVKENWYFDIVNPEHLSSLPIRVANLVRMTDHLSELKKYERLLVDLTDKVTALEKEVLKVRGTP